VNIFFINIKLGDFILVTGVTHTYMYTHTHACLYAHTYSRTYSIDPSVCHMACGYETTHNPMKT